MLDDFLEDELASYIITKCKADTTKLIGIYLFYGLKGAERNIFKPEVDTIKINSFFTPNREETFEEFLQRAKLVASSDDELEKLIEFPLIVRGLDENLKVFEDKFNTFDEVKDNIMLYEGLLKEGLKSAVSISKGNCSFFSENKNCFSIYMDVWKTTFDFVLKKQNGKYKIVAVQIPTA